MALPTKHHDVPGWFDDHALVLFRQVVRSAPKNAVFVEVGSYKGRSTVAMCEMLKACGRADIQFHIVDHWQGSTEHTDGERENIEEQFWANVTAAGFLRWIHGAHNKPSVEAAKVFGPGQCWFVYLDASHEYADVGNDIDAWWPKVATGGVLAGDDFGVPHGLPVGTLLPFCGVIGAVQQRLAYATRHYGRVWACEKTEEIERDYPRDVRRAGIDYQVDYVH